MTEAGNNVTVSLCDLHHNRVPIGFELQQQGRAAISLRSLREAPRHDHLHQHVLRGPDQGTPPPLAPPVEAAKQRSHCGVRQLLQQLLHARLVGPQHSRLVPLAGSHVQRLRATRAQ